jgi:hypothetical protein
MRQPWTGTRCLRTNSAHQRSAEATVSRRSVCPWRPGEICITTTSLIRWVMKAGYRSCGHSRPLSLRDGSEPGGSEGRDAGATAVSVALLPLASVSFTAA